MEREYKEISGEISGGEGNIRKYQEKYQVEREYKEILGKMEISGLE